MLLVALLMNNKIKANKSETDYFKKYFTPNLPFDSYRFIPKIASSSMDVSDGLILDLERMMNRQKLNYKIHIDKVPISKNKKFD